MFLRFPSKKRLISLLVLIGVCLFGLWALFGGLKGKGHVSYAERVVFKILGPVSTGASFCGEKVKKIIHHYFWLRRVKEENDRLKQKIIHLQTELVKAREHELEYERLLHLLKVAQKFKTPTLVARVIGRPIGSWQGLIIIDKGMCESVLPEMPVVYYTPEGEGALVGQVVATSQHYSKVLLITDPSSAVDVFIQRSRQRALLRGKKDGLCMLDYVPVEADVREKDIVITSGLDGIYPKGILVGEVVKIYPERENGLFLNIDVIPAASLKEVEQVLVILKKHLK